MSKKKDDEDAPQISGVPHLDRYLATRLTPAEQAQLAQTYVDGDPEGSQAIVNQANTRNSNGKKR